MFGYIVAKTVLKNKLDCFYDDCQNKSAESHQNEERLEETLIFV